MISYWPSAVQFMHEVHIVCSKLYVPASNEKETLKQNHPVDFKGCVK